MTRLVALLFALLALLRGVAAAADDVSIGMVRLPTPVFIALDQGYFAAEGLNVTPVFSQNGAEIVPAFATGKIDVALASPGAALFNVLALGVDAKIVADCWVAPRTRGSNDYAFIDVRKDLAASGKFRARDAKGLTFAITAHGQMTELFAAAYLQSAGLSLRRRAAGRAAVSRNGSGDAQPRDRSGLIDRTLSDARRAQRRKREGNRDHDVDAGLRQAVFMYGSRIATAKRDVGVRFMRAYNRANAFLLRNLATRAAATRSRSSIRSISRSTIHRSMK